MAKPREKIKFIKQQINFWIMLQNVAIASMNKGQFPVFLGAVVFLVMIFRMPSGDVSKLMFNIFEELKVHAYLGYILTFISLISWFIHSRTQRRWFAGEMERLSEERNKLQNRLLGGSIESSEVK